jgi:hypothetical protein
MGIDFKKVKLYIGIPCYGGNMKVPFVTSLFMLSQRLASLGVNHEIKIMGDSLIPRLRNAFAVGFLDSDCTHQLCLDCDIEFPPDAVIHMLDLDKELIGSAYTRKNINWENVEEAVKKGLPAKYLQEVTGNLVATLEQDIVAAWDAPVPVANIGTGLMVIKRSVYEKIRAAHPELEYDLAANDPQYTPGKKAWDFFGCFISEGEDGMKNLLSEDYAFCERAHEVDVQTWLLTCHRTAHYGDYGYVFNMPQLTQLTMQPKLQLPAFEDSVATS